MLSNRIIKWYCIVALLIILFFVVPYFSSEHFLKAILLPFLCLSLAALGQNIVTGYCGQLSVGSASFMAIGAYTGWNLATRLPQIPFIMDLVIARTVSAMMSVLFGFPSFRVRDFYLSATTLALVFIAEWVFTNVGWFYNYSISGTISFPAVELFGFAIKSILSQYYFTLVTVVLLAFSAHNMTRPWIGRAWMAVRDRNISAAAAGINTLATKLIAFAVSSFYLGIAGVLLSFFFYRSIEP